MVCTKMTKKNGKNVQESCVKYQFIAAFVGNRRDNQYSKSNKSKLTNWFIKFSNSEFTDCGLWRYMWLAITQYYPINFRWNSIAIRTNYNGPRLLDSVSSLLWWLNWQHFIWIYYQIIWPTITFDTDLNSSYSK